MAGVTLGPGDGTVEVRTYREGNNGLKPLSDKDRAEIRKRSTQRSSMAELTQSAFGITPYKALMGALKVRDEVEIVLDIKLLASR